MPLREVGFVGTGSYVPDEVITNVDLEKMVDTSDEWITTRTGIKERRKARPDEATSDIAHQAALRALENANVRPEELDAIILATVTPDMNFPSTACLLQGKLRALNAGAHDINAACCGSIYALRSARALIASGAADTVLVVAAESMTKYTDYEDRASCILFGDGAGAAVLRPTHGSHQILDSVAHADGHSDAMMSMILWNGGSARPLSEGALERREHLMAIKGREVYRFAVTRMSEVIREAAERIGVSVRDLDRIIPHQANLRILEGVAERIGLPIDKFYVNLDRYGNVSGASIAIALDEAVRDGSVRDGQLFCIAAFGGGLTWAAMTVRW